MGFQQLLLSGILHNPSIDTYRSHL